METEPQTIRFLVDLINYVQPKLIVEAGTYKGHFAIPAAQAATRWGGRVITWDIKEYPLVGPPPRNLEVRIGEFDLTGLRPDFAWLDAGPNYPPDPPRIRCHRHALEHIVPGGLILHHDTTRDDWIGAGEIKSQAGIVLLAGRGISLYQHPQ